MPVGLLHFDAIVSRSGLDVGEGLLALMVGDAFDLVEPSDRVAYVGGVVQRLFAFVGEGVDGGGEIVSFSCIEGFIVFVVLRGRLHKMLQRFDWSPGLRGGFVGWMYGVAKVL